MALAKNDPESDVLEAIARGDLRAAATVLVQAYGDDVARHCRLMLPTEDLAEEVRQQVFVQAFRDLGTCTRRSTYRNWLFGIARHRCLDALKTSRRRGARFVSATPLPETPDPRLSPEEELAARSATARLEEALASLAPHVRQAVLQRYVEEMTFVEMAQVSGDSPGTIQARVSRALPILRAALVGMVALAIALGAVLWKRDQSEARAKLEAALKATALADYEKEMKALKQNQADQDALLEQYKSAATEEDRKRLEDEIRRKQEAAMQIQGRADGARKKAGAGWKEADTGRRTIKVNCDPNDPLCGL